METRTDDLDIIELPGYTFKMKNRKRISTKRSGGIVVGYKDCLKDYIEVVETNSKYILWFKCNEQLLNIIDTHLMMHLVKSNRTS